jgi:long-chain acyl-CoA synthetase
MSFDSLPNITNIYNMGDIMQRTDLKKLVPQPKPYKKGPYSVEAKGYEKKDGETIPRVHPLAKDGLISTPAPDIKTIYDILRSSSKKFGNAKALGYRNLIKVHDEVKQIKKVVDGKETTTDKTWQYSELSPYTYLSFVEYEQLCFKLGSGYRALGMNKGDRIHIFASTSPWWLATAYGKPFLIHCIVHLLT